MFVFGKSAGAIPIKLLSFKRRLRLCKIIGKNVAYTRCLACKALLKL